MTPKNTDSAKSRVAGSGVKPTAKQRKMKFRRLLTLKELGRAPKSN